MFYEPITAPWILESTDPRIHEQFSFLLGHVLREKNGVQTYTYVNPGSENPVKSFAGVITDARYNPIETARLLDKIRHDK